MLQSFCIGLHLANMMRDKGATCGFLFQQLNELGPEAGVDGLMNACLAAYERLEGNYLLEVLRGSSNGND